MAKMNIAMQKQLAESIWKAWDLQQLNSEALRKKGCSIIQNLGHEQRPPVITKEIIDYIKTTKEQLLANYRETAELIKLTARFAKEHMMTNPNYISEPNPPVVNSPS